MPLKILKTFLVATGAVLFAAFFVPIPLRGVLNAGNATGLLLAAALIVYGLKTRAVNSFIKKQWASRFGKVLLPAAATCAGFLLSAFLATSLCMATATFRAAPKDATAIVLGCKIRDGKPSETLRSRLDAAYRYLSQNTGAKAVLSGGQGKDESISEAQCMFNDLTARGIAPDRLILEDKSTTTKENFAFSLEKIRERGLSKSVVIVTNEYHAYRASLYAKDLHLDFGTFAARSPAWGIATFWVREVFGIIRDWVL